LQNHIESLLEEGRIKLSSVITDLPGVNGRRILRALAAGETNPEKLPALGDRNLKCELPVLVDALTGSMGVIHCRLLTQHLERIDLIDRQIEQLNNQAATQMPTYLGAITRLIEVSGIGAEAA
jgi:transposase